MSVQKIEAGEHAHHKNYMFLNAVVNTKSFKRPIFSLVKYVQGNEEVCLCYLFGLNDDGEQKHKLRMIPLPLNSRFRNFAYEENSTCIFVCHFTFNY